MWVLVAMHAIFASTYTLGKLSLDYAQPIFFVGSRIFLSGVFLLLYQHFFNGGFYIKKSHIWLFAQLTFFQIYLTYLLEYSMFPYVDSSKMSLLFALTPFFTAFFSYIYFDERMTWKKLLGFGIGISAFAPSLSTEVVGE